MYIYTKVRAAASACIIQYYCATFLRREEIFYASLVTREVGDERGGGSDFFAKKVSLL
jgi:hypothetical protein